MFDVSTKPREKGLAVPANALPENGHDLADLFIDNLQHGLDERGHDAAKNGAAPRRSTFRH